MKQKYAYSGAPQVISLRGKDPDGKEKETEVTLRPGKEVELDGDSPYVKSLIARGFLKQAAAVEGGGASEAPGCPPPQAPPPASTEAADGSLEPATAKKGRK